MRGTYRFIQGGEVIAEFDNLITTAGKKALLEYVAGYTKSIAGSLAVGIGTTAANVADRKLAFEVSRKAVTNATVDYAAGAVVFKTQLPTTDELSIYEIGAHTSAEEGAGLSQLLLDFDVNTDAWSVGTFVATNSRIGSALQVTATASTTTDSTLNDLALDLSAYSALDTFTFATRANNAFASSIAWFFKTDASNYYLFSLSTPVSGTYNLTTYTKSQATVVGTPNWANITQVTVRVTATAGGTASVDFDGIRIDDTDANKEESVLFSRAVLGSPVVKTVGLPLDIEYAVTL